MLTSIRMELEKISVKEAIDAVLRDNIHGLELDMRCVEIAAFNLAFTAWTYPGAEGWRPLPELHLACSGLSVGASKEDWEKIAKGNKRLEFVLDQMYEYFKNAPVLGSLLDPSQFKAYEGWASWEQIQQAVNEAFSLEDTPEWHETAIAAQGLAKAAELLSGKYHWVITNPPYLARGKQDDVLKDFLEKTFPKAKNDIATSFLERCLKYCIKSGTVSIVLPQNWLFLTTYKHFREKLLKGETWKLIARLGAGAFETITGEVVKAILITMSRDNAQAGQTALFQQEKQTQLIHGLDVSDINTPIEKASQLIDKALESVEQIKQLENPDARIILDSDSTIELLSKYANAYQGIATGDYPHFGRFFWEIQNIDNINWIFQLLRLFYIFQFFIN
jgi:hypothetical protein